MPHDPLPRRSRIPLGVLTAGFVVVAAEYTFHLDTTLRNVLKVGVYNIMLAAGLVCIVRAVRVDRERGVWLAMGAAVLAWGHRQHRLDVHCRRPRATAASGRSSTGRCSS